MAEKLRAVRARRLRRTGAATAALITTALVVGILFAISAAASSQATPCTTQKHLVGSNFEIDTNANLKVDGPADCIDWLSGGSGTQFRSGVISKGDKPTGSGDDSFGQGTSEDDANPTIVDGSIPPNKSDLTRFGVYTEINGSNKFLELFWSRVQNPSGTTNMDFELNAKFCDPSATPTNCADNGKNFPAETPIRTAGDKLISYDLSKGGTVPTISIRTWNGSAWGSPTVISGGGSGACTQAAITNCAVGSVNSTAIPAAEGGALGARDPFTFGEAAIAYEALFPSGISGCGKFGSAYLKSRSSDSFNAELKDFIGPESVNITNCTSISTLLSSTSITVGGSVSDSATLTGATGTAGGTVTYTVYTNSACTQGAQSAGTKTVTNGVVPNSDSVTFNSVGTFYWQAVYSGDANNAGATSVCTEEQVVVNKAQPSISTTLSATAIDVGQSAHDSATLTGATSDAGGTVTYSVYDNSNCTGTAVSGGTKNVSAGAVPDSDSLTFNSPGTFYWQVVYSGDAKNETATSVCTSEQIVVSKLQPSISTTLSATSINVGQSAHDSATLTGATSDAGGTVTYSVYDNSNCTGTAVSGGTKNVSAGVVPDSDSVTFNSPGTFYWQVVYSGDAKNEGATSVCTSEQIVVNQIQSTISTDQAFYPNDTATIGGGGTGNVRFRLYSGATCDGSALLDESRPIGNNGKASTNNYPGGDANPYAITQSGTYSWLVEYAGDTTHTGATSACSVEHVVITITNGS